MQFDNANFFIRSKNSGNLTGVKWGSLGECFLSAENIGGDCEAVPTNVIRYDSPVFAGFSMSADWGQNGGYWDAYARYSGEYNGIKIAATTGWSQANTAEVLQSSPIVGGSQIGNPQYLANTSCTTAGITPLNNTLVGPSNSCDVGYWQSGIYLEHVATGVFVYGAYGREFLSDIAPGFNDNPDHWMVKAGLRERWHPLGHSIIYGFYEQRNDMFDNGAVGGATGLLVDPHGNTDTHLACSNCVVTSSRTNEWGAGFVQEIDAAAMSLWVQAEHFDAKASGCANGINASGDCLANPGFATTAGSALDGMTVVKFGGLINF